MSQEEQEQQQKFLDPKFFQTQIFFVPKFFSDPNFISGPNFFGPKILFDFFPNQIFFLTQNNFWTNFFSDPKRCLEGENKASNWQRAKVLLKLEFDTEDQVLFISCFYLCVFQNRG